MSSTTFCAAILLLCAVTFSAAQTSCKGRCGAEYYRGYMCQCDYTCLSYGECCKDFAAQCTTRDSCKGRCGESFRRGRLCSCDLDCAKFKQCCSDFQNHCDETEPLVSGAPDQTSTFSEGDNADDDLIPLVGPTTYPEDDLSDDMYGPTYPNDYFSDNDVEMPEATPIPESTSGYGSSAADLPDQLSTEPTQDPDVVEISTEAAGISTEPTQDPDVLEISTEAVTEASQPQTTISENEPTQASDSPTTLSPNTEAASTDSPDANDPTSSGVTPPQPTTPAVSSQPALPTEPQQGDSPAPDIQEPVKEVPPEADISPEAEETDPTVLPADEPDVTTLAPNTASSPTVASASTGPTQDSAADSTSPAASMLDPAATTLAGGPNDANTAEVTTEPPSPLPDLEDSPVSVSTTRIPTEPDAATTIIPTSTDAVQGDVEDATPKGTTADPLNLTPVPTKPTTSEATSKPQDKPEVLKPVPTSEATSKPQDKPEVLKPVPTSEATSKPQDKPEVLKPVPTSEATSKPQAKPEVLKPVPVPVQPALAKPSSKPVTKPLDTQTLSVDDSRGYQADDSNDTNLCSGRPVSGVTTLRNGTIVVFRGHFFWFLDRNRVPGPARDITQVWGVPSPIDTVFTRCNCQGKTYIFKGPQYWRYENDILDPGFPKVVTTGFDGLRGHITAALSVPQYQSRREAVYFFKRGGTVQKYSYQFGTSTSCGRKPQYAIYTVKNRIVRQAVSALGTTINIRASWRGFPSTVTAAVSIPSYREPEGFKYYVVSRSKSYKVRMDSGRPQLAAPAANTSPQSNSIFRCPKKV
ncbi:proteoglycan 4-like isoform X2 [Notolabrus celidotus]|uniref:proteoglycan 4-like isoform X2 n=1 Tax=Notolabrus celidotus TaxID=1203425 RepID=UPI0014906847|nr:proteoglycan 4-like isoform X2 [Notolabrus celidotus]